jgi:uncharacterized DUF497 family protein
MQDDEFEWDDVKAAQNYRVHHVTFETARQALRDPFVLERIDTREDYGEDRYRAIGMVRNRLIHVAFTTRNGRTRIISARKAEPQERREYHEKRN